MRSDRSLLPSPFNLKMKDRHPCERRGRQFYVSPVWMLLRCLSHCGARYSATSLRETNSAGAAAARSASGRGYRQKENGAEYSARVRRMSRVFRSIFHKCPDEQPALVPSRGAGRSALGLAGSGTRILSTNTRPRGNLQVPSYHNTAATLNILFRTRARC